MGYLAANHEVISTLQWNKHEYRLCQIRSAALTPVIAVREGLDQALSGMQSLVRC
jgi:hypothetical protein